MGGRRSVVGWVGGGVWWDGWEEEHGGMGGRRGVVGWVGGEVWWDGWEEGHGGMGGRRGVVGWVGGGAWWDGWEEGRGGMGGRRGVVGWVGGGAWWDGWEEGEGRVEEGGAEVGVWTGKDEERGCMTIPSTTAVGLYITIPGVAVFTQTSHTNITHEAYQWKPYTH